MPKLIELDSASFTEAIDNDFGFTITDVEPIMSGWSNQVFKAIFKGDVIFIHINKSAHVFPAEILGYALFEKQGIPVPSVLAYQENPKTIGFPTMIMTAAKGIALREAELSSDQKNDIFKQAGELMKKIHEVKLEGFGPAQAHGSVLRGKFSSWKENWLSVESHYREEFDQAVQSELFTNDEVQKLRAIYADVQAVDFSAGSLLHQDIHGAHIFVTDQKISGIIDLGRLLVGDPRYDVAMSLVFQSEEQQEFFKKGYGELAYDPFIFKYLAIITATKTILRHKRGLLDASKKAQQTFREALEKV